MKRIDAAENREKESGFGLKFPPFPKDKQEIYNYPGRGERMACAIVHNCTIKQLMAFRELRLLLGEQSFRETLVEGLDILSKSKTITTPAGWLYSYIESEAKHV